MMKINKFMFLNTMILGTLIAISSYSWFSMWVGLEMNLLASIPVFSSDNMLSSEASMKYFISQIIASLLIISSIMILMKKGLIENYKTLWINILNSMLLMKMGAAPLHFWFPEVMEGLSWINCLILMTWQKISPSIILMNNWFSHNIMIIFIIFSAMISTVMSFNQKSMRKILSFSSINHISWLISLIMISASTWLIYFIVYSLLTISIILQLNINKINMISQMMEKENLNQKISLSLSFMSMGGLPPLIGFMPKWFTINKLIENYMELVSMILICSSLLMLFIYLRTIIHFLLITKIENKMKSTKYPNNNLNISMLLINFSLPLAFLFN